MTTEQLFLPGVDGMTEPRDSLFLAVFPDANAGTQISRLARQIRAAHGLDGRPLAEDRLHVSLYSLGKFYDVPADVVRSASLACESIAASQAPFEVQFGILGSFAGRPSNRPLVLRDKAGNVALMEFHRRLGLALSMCGIRRLAPSQLTPHVTLSYTTQSMAEERVNPVSWMVTEFVLVHSLLGQTRHLRLGSWTFHG